MNRQRVQTRWCPVHDTEMLKRGTRRCKRCTSDVILRVRRRIVVPDSQIKRSRAKGEPTKRAIEARTKGRARP